MSGGTKGGGEVIMEALNMFPNSVKTVGDAKKSKEFLDLLSVYSQLTISESILTPFQTGSITINDSNDMMLTILSVVLISCMSNTMCKRVL